jgi:hypothetical protein
MSAAIGAAVASFAMRKKPSAKRPTRKYGTLKL